MRRSWPSVPWQDARARFLRNKAAVVSLILLVLITLACIVGPWLLPNEFDSTDWNATRYICVGSAALSTGTRWRTAT